MKGTKKIVRNGVFALLNNAITYDSIAVPVVDEKQRNTTASNLFIVLSTQQEVPEESNDHCFITRSSIDILVIQKTGTEVSKDAIDDVTEAITLILFPTPGAQPIAAVSGFQIHSGMRESSVTQAVELSATESVLQSITRVSYLITQQ